MDEWFSVKYEWPEKVPPISVSFLAYKIESVSVDSFTLEDKPVMEGFIKWDGCSEIETKSHYCGLQELEQMFSCLRKIYDFADSILHPEAHQNRVNVYSIQGGE